MKSNDFLTTAGKVMVYLASHGAVTKGVELSTLKLAEELGVSQQTISRVLIDLELKGLIERTEIGRKRMIKLTENGIRKLLDMYAVLKEVFETPVELELQGSVFTGLGEGAYYLQIPYYVKKFEEKLGFKPFPGTLNIRLLGKSDIIKRLMIEKAADIVIESFADEKRSYGGAKCIRARLNDEEVAIVFAERTHYSKEVVEIIAPIPLREKLGLKDGDRVKLRVKISPMNL